MSDIICEQSLSKKKSPPQKKKKESKYPHGAPRDPKKVREIARLREKEELQWRDIGPKVGITFQGACLLYNHWKREGWLE